MLRFQPTDVLLDPLIDLLISCREDDLQDKHIGVVRSNRVKIIPRRSRMMSFSQFEVAHLGAHGTLVPRAARRFQKVEGEGLGRVEGKDDRRGDPDRAPEVAGLATKRVDGIGWKLFFLETVVFAMHMHTPPKKRAFSGQEAGVQM